MNPGSVLEVRNVTVRFGGLTALDAVSLAVPPNHVMGVIGPNGAGKTTLLNVLCGFIRPDHGDVLFDGRRHQVRPYQLSALGVARTLQGVGLYNGSGRRCSRCRGQGAMSAGCVTWPAGHSSGSARPRWQTHDRRGCPTGCARRWPWPGRWSPSRS